MSSRLRILCATATLAGALALLAPSAHALTSSTLLYSVDGGQTWTSSVTVAPEQTVQVRQWFNNNGTSALPGTAVRTSLPNGVSLVPGTTEVCLDPSTSNPQAPVGSEALCEASDEPSTWSGDDLEISPSAGFYGESPSSTSGYLQIGRKRYFNLRQCAYFNRFNNAGSWLTTITPDPSSNDIGAVTNASNAAATGNDCGPGADATASGHQALPLLGRRYVNLHQCTYRNGNGAYFSAVNPNQRNGTGLDARSSTGNVPAAAPDCGPAPSGWTLRSDLSGFRALDLQTDRYLKLQSCQYRSTSDTMWFGAFVPNAFDGAAMDANVRTSGVTTSALDCGAPSAGFNLSSASPSDHHPIDILDTTRGSGYVAYSVTAPAVPSAAACAAGPVETEALVQRGELGAGGSVQASSGTLTVDFSNTEAPCDQVGVPLVDPVVGVAGLAVLGLLACWVLRRSMVAPVP